MEQTTTAHTMTVASYPGLLTPEFVTCSTNMGEGLVKLITCNDVLDVWRSGTFPEQVSALLIANTDHGERLST